MRSQVFWGGWMSADSWPPHAFVATVFWLGRGFGFLGVGGPWLALGFEGGESLQTPTSDPRGPIVALGWAAGKARSEGDLAGL